MAKTTAKPPVRKYLLLSEIERTHSKHPDFLIAVPEVTIKDDNDDDVVLPAKDIRVPPTARWDDDILTLSRTDGPGAARALIGVDDYRHFVAAGGYANLLFEIAAEHAQADMGESGASATS